MRQEGLKFKVSPGYIGRPYQGGKEGRRGRRKEGTKRGSKSRDKYFGTRWRLPVVKALNTSEAIILFIYCSAQAFHM
jgi:hypothetical protein